MKRKVDFRKRIRRTPFGFYLTAGAVLSGLLVGGIGLGRLTAQAVVVDMECKPSVLAEQYDAPVETSGAPTYTEEQTYTEEELEILSLIIFQEAGGDAMSDECRQMVGEVFLNRVASRKYPNTFYEVATQNAQYGRLSWTGIVWPERASKPEESHAVQRAYDMAEALLSGTVTRLLPEDVVFQSEYIQGTEIVVEVDGFYFCR